MITVSDLIGLQTEARGLVPFPESRFPPSMYYRYLGVLARKLNARVFVELGTCGGGAAYNVAKINPTVKVITIDVVKYATVDVALTECKNIEFVLGDSVGTAAVLGPLYIGRIDLLFIDTIHTFERTMAEFNAWRPYMSKGAVVCFDDLNREGMDRVWAALPEPKTGFHDLRTMHLSGAPTDGGFGALLIQ